MRSPYRVLLAALGVLCVGIAGVGAVVPGLPTTVFLLLASYLFARSCPVLERRLLHNRLFRPYLDGVRPGGAMSRRAKRVALLSMWTAVAASVTFMVVRGGSPGWVPPAVVAAAMAGTGVILRRPDGGRREPPGEGARPAAGASG